MKRLPVYACFWFGLFSGSALKAQPGATLAGRLVDEGGVAIPGAAISYSRAAKYEKRRQPGRRPTLALIEPRTGGTTRSGPDGSFSLTGLADGRYTLCVSVPGDRFLDPCQWSAVPFFIVAGGRASALGPIRLQRAALLRVRINDSRGHLLAPVKPPIERLIVGVRTANWEFHPARVVSTDPTGRNLVLPVPLNRPLRLWIFSRTLRISDAANAPIDTDRGYRLPVTVPPGTAELAFTFQVTGLR